MDVHETDTDPAVAPVRLATLVQFGVAFEQMRIHLTTVVSTDQRATAPAAQRLYTLSTLFTPRAQAALLTPIVLRQSAANIRELRQQLLTLQSSGMLLDDDALQAANVQANTNLVAQWKASTPDLFDRPLKALYTDFQNTWSDVFVEVGSDDVWGCVTDPSHPEYGEEWWVKVFTVLRGLLGVVGGSGERLVFVGVGVVVVGVVVWLMGVGG